MTIAELERRLATLEKTVEHLMIYLAETNRPPSLQSAETAGDGPSGQPWYIREAGRFRDDPIFDEIVRLGREYRQSLPVDEGDGADDDHP